MIDHIKEKRMVEQNIVVKAKCTCDICGKTIYEYDMDKQDNTNSAKTSIGHRVYFWSIDTHCNIEDSYETKHACSQNCLASIMMDYIKESENDGDLNDVIEVEYVHKYIQ